MLLYVLFYQLKNNKSPYFLSYHCLHPTSNRPKFLIKKMSSLVLGVRHSLYDLKRIKIDNVNFETKINTFKDEVSKKANMPKETLELVYCGNVLDDDLTLASCGVKPGVVVHVLKKKAKGTPIPTPKMSESDIQALVLAFKTLTLSSSCRSSLQKLSRPDILENIIMITPGLSQDPVAISMIQDPELLVRMGDIETVRKIVQHHPALAEAANHIAAAVHEEAVSGGASHASTSAGLAHLMDMLSDDDDMESSQSSDSVQQGISRQQSFSAITSAQLAAAIASAAQNSGASTSGNDSNTITPEMVNEAMQRAMATVAPSSSNSSIPILSPQLDMPERNADNLTDQMRQMRELGLTDDAVNLQALQLAGGNVHAAVDLVFSGAISNNH